MLFSCEAFAVPEGTATAFHASALQEFDPLKTSSKYLETFFIASGNLMENKLSFVTPKYGPLFFTRST
jgi:hypothetical protein